MQINTERIDNEVKEQENKFLEMKKSRDILVDSVNKYLILLEPILKKKKIKIKSSQMYFNIMSDRCIGALANVKFEEVYGDYKNIKVKRLQQEIRDARIPCPAGSPTNSVEITVYPGVLYEERFKDEVRQNVNDKYV